MKEILLRKTLFIIFLIYLLSSVFCISRQLFAHPTDSIITNNNHINHQQTLKDLTTEIQEDSLNYTFKKEEILNNLTSFKIEFLNTLNTLIAQEKYTTADKYLNTYLHFYEDDIQVLALQKLIQEKLSLTSLPVYNGDIEVLSFKPLISYPQSVFANKNSSSTRLDENHITIDEFSKILLSLYEKNYILISPNLLLTTNNKTLEKQQLHIPYNKRPLILILEDVEYNSKTNGCVDRLLIDRNDQLSTYTPKRAINDRIHTNNDFITILENFVMSHPSFSHNGAKALIVVDGSNGIFGYNTQRINATSKYEIKKAIEVINYLKHNGYTFASSGYNTTINDPIVTFASGINSWQTDIAPIVGNSNIFYLNNSVKNLNENFSEHFKILNNFNYSIYIGIEIPSTFEFNSLLNGFYLTTKQINGKTLRYSKDSLSHLFDCEKIYDHINRTIPYSS